MVRRAGRATPSELARYNASAQKSFAKEAEKDLRRTVARMVQGAAIEICNDLVKAGPIWSGRFASSWYMENIGNIGGSRVSWSIYKYSAKDFRVTSIEKALKSGITDFSIINTSDHAQIAIDGQTSIYQHPNSNDPLKDPVQFGFRPKDGFGDQIPSYRWDVSMGYGGSKPNAMITAEPDWMGAYALDGRLSQSLEHGIRLSINAFSQE